MQPQEEDAVIELYGAPMSSSGRTRWMLEEVGVPYEYKRVDTRSGQTRSPEYLALYGGGKVPVLRDGDLVLGESIAINFYLAEKYKPELMPSELAQRARAYQWSLWGVTNLQNELLTIMFDAMKPPEQRNAAATEAAKSSALSLLQFLERSLAGRSYLLGEQLSVADVNLGSVVNLARRSGLLAELPNTAAWMERLAARPAYLRATKD
jgi:glutathione S-transferase